LPIQRYDPFYVTGKERKEEFSPLTRRVQHIAASLASAYTDLPPCQSAVAPAVALLSKTSKNYLRYFQISFFKFSAIPAADTSRVSLKIVQ
jgi:hypothetical protein